MKQLTRDAFWLTSSVGAHCYWLDAGDRVAIIDPGMKGGLNPVARELRAAGRSPYEVTDILLTHYDIDHTGAAAEWQRRTGARAWIGAADAAILTGAVPPPATPFRQFMSMFTPVELPGKLQLIEGDTELWPGLIALHRAGDRLALTSDCFYTVDPLTSLYGPPRVPLAAFNQDTERARASIRKLAALAPASAWPGHAEPLRGDVEDALETAAATT